MPIGKKKLPGCTLQSTSKLAKDLIYPKKSNLLTLQSTIDGNWDSTRARYQLVLVSRPQWRQSQRSQEVMAIKRVPKLLRQLWHPFLRYLLILPKWCTCRWSMNGWPLAKMVSFYISCLYMSLLVIAIHRWLFHCESCVPKGWSGQKLWKSGLLSEQDAGNQGQPAPCAHRISPRPVRLQDKCIDFYKFVEESFPPLEGVSMPQNSHQVS